MDWQAMVFLGAYHGINPGMGWLFAVALGLQQGSARGVWRALPPIVVGHALSVGVVLVTAGLAQIIVPLEMLHVLVAALLISMGLYRLWRHGHPRFGGMQVGFRDLTVWSFLMASAHGAGLMVLPFVMQAPAPLSASAPLSAAAPHPVSHSHAHHVAAASPNAAALDALAIAVHTLAYLVVMTLVAWIVYRKFGVSFLRTAWFNLDLVWAVALVITGVVVLT